MVKEIIVDIKLKWRIYKLNNAIKRIERELDRLT